MEFVLAAVKQDGRALEYVSEELKSNREVVLAALSASSNPDFVPDYESLLMGFLWGDQEITFRLLDIYGDDLPRDFLFCFV